ncbi:hypothetical protein GZH53_06905 [Flavihumibacter sp. R14]|nr:hypothetical protein [Flavihumibacter soli]
MTRNNVLTVSTIVMIILALIMIFLGFRSGPKILYPPVITGIGFIVIAWVLSVLKDK